MNTFVHGLHLVTLSTVPHGQCASSKHASSLSHSHFPFHYPHGTSLLCASVAQEAPLREFTEHSYRRTRTTEFLGREASLVGLHAHWLSKGYIRKGAGDALLKKSSNTSRECLDACKAGHCQTSPLVLGTLKRLDAKGGVPVPNESIRRGMEWPGRRRGGRTRN